MIDFLGRALKDGDKVVYANYRYNPERLFSKPLQIGTIICHETYGDYSEIKIQAEGGYIATASSRDAIKIE